MIGSYAKNQFPPTIGHDPQRALCAQGINVSTSTVNSTRLDMEARATGDLIRASVHYYNSDDEIDRLCAAIAALA